MENKEFREALIKKSYDFSLEVIRLVEELKKKGVWFSLLEQLLRAATSIGANIVEAQGSSSRRDFINFIHYAFKSCWETRYWLGLLKDAGYLAEDRYVEMFEKNRELTKILNSILLSLKGKK